MDFLGKQADRNRRLANDPQSFTFCKNLNLIVSFFSNSTCQEPCYCKFYDVAILGCQCVIV